MLALLRGCFVVALCVGSVACEPGAATTRRGGAASAPAVDVDVVPVATTPPAPASAPPGEAEVRLVLSRLFQSINDCSHDEPAGDLRCVAPGRALVGSEPPASQRVRPYALEDGGAVMATSEWSPVDVLERVGTDTAVATCRFAATDTWSQALIGSPASGRWFLVAMSLPVGRLSRCTFEPWTVDRLAAAHLVVMVSGGPRTPARVTRDRTEAERVARRALLEAQDPAVPFSDLVARYSDEPGAVDRGGDLGEFPLRAMVASFAWMTVATPVGGRSGLVETEFGFHLIERRPLR